MSSIYNMHHDLDLFQIFDIDPVILSSIHLLIKVALALLHVLLDHQVDAH